MITNFQKFLSQLTKRLRLKIELLNISNYISYFVLNLFCWCSWFVSFILFWPLRGFLKWNLSFFLLRAFYSVLIILTLFNTDSEWEFRFFWGCGRVLQNYPFPIWFFSWVNWLLVLSFMNWRKIPGSEFLSISLIFAGLSLWNV